MANYNKRSGGKSVGAKLAIVLFIILAIAAGLFGAGLGTGYIQFNNNKQQSAATEIGETGGAIVTDTTAYGLSLKVSAFSAASVNDEDNISIADGSTARVTVEYEPSYLTTVKFDYSLEFVNPSSEWTEGKNVEDYMTFTPDSDGATAGVLTCIQPFGEQIILTATARDDGGASGTVTLGYIARPEITSATLCATDFEDSAEYEFGYSLGTGTHFGEFSGTVTLNISDSFVSDLTNLLDFDITFVSHTFNVYSETYADGYFCIADAVSDIMTYDMFIGNFDSLTEQQKNELYYVWWQVFENGNYISNGNVLADYSINYTFNGKVISSFAESDLPGDILSGAVYGSEVVVTNVNVNDGCTILF